MCCVYTKGKVSQQQWAYLCISIWNQINVHDVWKHYIGWHELSCKKTSASRTQRLIVQAHIHFVSVGLCHVKLHALFKHLKKEENKGKWSLPKKFGISQKAENKTRSVMLNTSGQFAKCIYYFKCALSLFRASKIIANKDIQNTHWLSNGFGNLRSIFFPR